MQAQGLGNSLKTARRGAGLSQGELAAKAGVHRNAVSAVENGRGHIETLVLLAAALGLEVEGRNLGGNGPLGPRLEALRKRRRLGRRAVADLAGVSVPALESVERTGAAHIASMEAVGQVLGAGLCLRAKGEAFGFWESIAASSAHEEWYTPPWLLDRLYRVVGGRFDLDPCSPTRSGARAPVHARVRYTAEDDALKLPWKGRTIFMNLSTGVEN